MPADPPTTIEAIGRLLGTWSAATGSATAVPQADPTTLGYVRELGHYLGETLRATGTNTGVVTADMTPTQKMALEQGIVLEWLGAARADPAQALAALAAVARMLHAAIDGVRALGKYDVEDAHEYAADLQGCLAAIAGNSGVVEETVQILARSRGTER